MALPAVHARLLNEVLSLNAQEFVRHIPTHNRSTFLNEVLSLNAQEFRHPPIELPS